MTQTTPRFCSNCGTSAPTGQRFCSNCGAAVGSDTNSPTVSTGGEQIYQANSNIQNSPAYGPTVLAPGNQTNQAQGGLQTSPSYSSSVQSSAAPSYVRNSSGQELPPPPPPDSLVQAPQQALYTPIPSQSSSYYSSPTQQTTPPLPDYARVQKRSPLRRLITLVSILLILALLAGGFLLLRSILASNGKSTNSNNQGAQSTAATNSAGSSSTATATAASGSGSGQNGTATTGSGVPVNAQEQLNLMVTYASIELTIASVQQADSFSDDSSVSQPGVVRINIQEHNPTTHAGNFLYSDVTRLILPDGSTIVAPDSEQNAIGPDAAVSRTNWIDFPVSTKVDLSKLVLRLGTPTENQMDVSLSPNADLSKYKLKMVNLNVKFQYAGLDWTVTTATASLSDSNRQASQGMRYIVVTLKVDNPTSTDFSAYWGDYIRLKSGAITSSPTADTSFPLTFPAGSAGTSGSVIFLMPQDSSSFTLVMLARDTSPPISQATANFQIR